LFVANKSGTKDRDRTKRSKPAPKAAYTGARASDLQPGTVFYVLDEGYQKVLKGKTEVITKGPWSCTAKTGSGVMAVHITFKVQTQLSADTRVSLTQPD